MSSFFFFFKFSTLYPVYSSIGYIYSNVVFVAYGYLLQNSALKLIKALRLRYCASMKQTRFFLELIHSEHGLTRHLSVGFHLSLIQIHIPLSLYFFQSITPSMICAIVMWARVSKLPNLSLLIPDCSLLGGQVLNIMHILKEIFHSASLFS